MCTCACGSRRWLRRVYTFIHSRDVVVRSVEEREPVSKDELCMCARVLVLNPLVQVAKYRKCPGKEENAHPSAKQEASVKTLYAFGDLFNTNSVYHFSCSAISNSHKTLFSGYAYVRLPYHKLEGPSDLLAFVARKHRFGGVNV